MAEVVGAVDNTIAFVTGVPIHPALFVSMTWRVEFAEAKSTVIEDAVELPSITAVPAVTDHAYELPALGVIE
jgi:hypothetical protein